MLLFQNLSRFQVDIGGKNFQVDRSKFQQFSSSFQVCRHPVNMQNWQNGALNRNYNSQKNAKQFKF